MRKGVLEGILKLGKYYLPKSQGGSSSLRPSLLRCCLVAGKATIINYGRLWRKERACYTQPVAFFSIAVSNPKMYGYLAILFAHFQSKYIIWCLCQTDYNVPLGSATKTSRYRWLVKSVDNITWKTTLICCLNFIGTRLLLIFLIVTVLSTYMQNITWYSKTSVISITFNQDNVTSL